MISKSHNAKKVISVIIALAMIVSLFTCMSGLDAFAINNKEVKSPIVGATAPAGGYPEGFYPTQHCECGNHYIDADGNDAYAYGADASACLYNDESGLGCDGTILEWTPYVDAATTMAGGNFYLTGNLNEPSQWTAKASIRLDLNGYTYQRDANGRMYSGNDCKTTKVRFAVTDTSAGKTGAMYAGYRSASTNNGGVIWAGAGKIDIALYRLHAAGKSNNNLAGGVNGGFLYTTTIGNTVAVFDSEIGEALASNATENKATQGGCMYLSGADFYAENSTFTGTETKHKGTASDRGGAFYITNTDTATPHTQRFNNCTITGGKVNDQGGAFYLGKGTNCKTNTYFTGCTIQNGDAGTLGGNFYTNGSTTDFTDCIIKDGHAGDRGGNVYIGSGTNFRGNTEIIGGSSDKTNCSVAANYGGIFYDNSRVYGITLLDQGTAAASTPKLYGNTKLDNVTFGIPTDATKIHYFDIAGLTSAAEGGTGYLHNINVLTNDTDLGKIDRALFKAVKYNQLPLLDTPTIGGTAYRVDATTKGLVEAEHVHCICGDTACTNQDHEKLVFQPYTNTMRTTKLTNGGFSTNGGSLPTAGNWYLSGVDTMSTQTQIKTTTANICFNGNYVNVTTTRAFQFAYKTEATAFAELSLCDCQGTGGVHKEIAEKGNLVFVQGFYGTDRTSDWGFGSYRMNIYGGNYDFSQCVSSNKAAISFSQGPTDGTPYTAELNVYGGDIKLGTNEATSTMGNIIFYDTFNMYGGTIDLGTTKYLGTGTSYGGGMQVRAGATFNMYGGTLKNGTLDATENTRTSKTLNTGGGNLYVVDNGNFNMYGGIIEGGKVIAGGLNAWALGGNVLFAGQANINLEAGNFVGGLITFGDNVDASSSSKYSYGGNIASNQSLTIKDGIQVLGGKITNKEGRDDAFGGNIAVMEGTFTMTGGKVSGGEVDIITKSDGKIMGSFGGNIFTYRSNFDNQITGGEIGTEVVFDGTTYVGGKANNGGNIQTGWGGEVNMTVAGNAVVANGEAAASGGNICTWGNSSLTVGGDAVITDGKAKNGNGGNIYVHSDSSKNTTTGITTPRASTLTMTGGTIKNGSSIKVTTGGSGSEVFVTGKKTGTNPDLTEKTPVFTMSGGTIDREEGKGTGSGLVYVQGDFNMTGGEILGDGSTSSVVAGDNNANILIDGGKLVKAGNNQNKTFKITGESEVSSYTGSFSKPIDLDGLTSTTEAVVSCSSPAIGKQLFTNLPTGYEDFITLDETLAEEYVLAADGTLAKNGPATREQCVCGGNAQGIGDHDCDDVEFTEWTKTDELPTEGNYYLAEDVTVSATTTLTGDLNLDLDGHKIEKSEAVAIFEVPAEMTLGITSSVDGGVIDGKEIEVDGDGGNIIVKGTFNLYSGAIQDGAVAEDGKGGNVYVHQGAFMNMYEGSVTGGSATKGGNIALNYSKTGAGSHGTLNMYGGTIDYGTADLGGNVFVYDTAEFNMYDGTVENSVDGYDVYLSYRYDEPAKAVDGATLNMEDGSIGTVYAVRDHSVINQTGGTINEIYIVILDKNGEFVAIDEVDGEKMEAYEEAQEIFEDYKDEDGNFSYEYTQRDIDENPSTIFNTETFSAMDEQIGDNDAVREQMAQIVEDYIGEQTTFADAMHDGIEYKKALEAKVEKLEGQGAGGLNRYVIYATIDELGIRQRVGQDEETGLYNDTVTHWGYDYVGFDIELNGHVQTYRTDLVFTSIEEVLSESDRAEISTKSDYVFFCTIDLPDAAVGYVMNVTAVVVVEDGRVVSGNTMDIIL